MQRFGLMWLLFSAIVWAQLSPPPTAAGEPRIGILNGRAVRYQIANGHAAAGDVLLARLAAAGRLPESSTTSKLWTGGVIPYVFDAGFVNKERILRAIQLWQDGTGLQFVARTSQTNYLKFVSPSFGCNSFVGMQGGEQVLNMAESCFDGATVHELGHAIGLYHEHTRLDRAQWVQIVKDNIIATCPFDMDFGLAAGSKDLGSYDFGSVMHYDGWASTRNGYPTIQTIPRISPSARR